MNAAPHTLARMRLALPVLLVSFAATPALAQDNPWGPNDARTRINKAWDERIARMQRALIENQCKEAAKQAYAAIRFNKRREFVEECVKNASAPAPTAHAVQ